MGIKDFVRTAVPLSNRPYTIVINFNMAARMRLFSWKTSWSFMESINLAKGQRIDLTKGNPGLIKAIIGLGWDTN